jgi:Arc/MetJ-type ribon-helix-helix transcriptional regulator
MSKRTRITISIDERVLAEIDNLVRAGVFRNRSAAINAAIHRRPRRSRLAREAAKLDRAEEQAWADEGYADGRS